MTINPGHLFDQADQLAGSASGAPRQADLRRAISAAYYAVFHTALTEMADQLIGITQRGASEYALAYRSLDHRTLKAICTDIKATTLPPKYAKYAIPQGSFGPELRAFSAAVVELQEKRHDADYNPMATFRRLDVQTILSTARAAVRSLAAAPAPEKRLFLTLLAFQPR